ncbi:MAG: hypothetical protein APF80_01650 [Alphaproteobacteria bacterium BRH_c36]|nr:MAG: hypothetical protein APF80_01650 [Alphaproteobacteria bacterium BRH_c36]
MTSIQISFTLISQAIPQIVIWIWLRKRVMSCASTTAIEVTRHQAARPSMKAGPAKLLSADLAT